VIHYKKEIKNIKVKYLIARYKKRKGFVSIVKLSPEEGSRECRITI
jgi:hypothetical protein